MTTAGTVKAFNPVKGWGFVTVEGDSDVFLHIKGCTDGVPQVGDNVVFDKEEAKNKPGQFNAVNVIGCTGKDTGKGKGKGKNVEVTGTCTGTCKSFAAMKGWGFVEHEGSDVFVRIQDCVDGGVPKTGDVLTFDVEASPVKEGSLKASNVTGGTGWPIEDKGKGKGDGWGGDWGKGGWGGDKGWGKGGGWDSWGKGGWGAGPYDGGKGGKSWDGGKGGKGWGKDSWGGKGW